MTSNAAKPRLGIGYEARHQEAPWPTVFHLQTGLKPKHMRPHVRGNHEALHLRQHSEGMCRHRRGGCRTHSVEGVHVQFAVLQWACVNGLATSKQQPKSSKKQQVKTPVGQETRMFL